MNGIIYRIENQKLVIKLQTTNQLAGDLWIDSGRYENTKKMGQAVSQYYEVMTIVLDNTGSAYLLYIKQI